MFSSAIDTILTGLEAREVKGEDKVINFSEYFYDNAMTSALDGEDKMIVQHLMVEYAVLGSSGESAVFDLLEDAMYHGIWSLTRLDSEDDKLIEALDHHIFAMRRSIDKQVSIYHSSSNVISAVTEWIGDINGKVAIVKYFHVGR